MSLNIKCYTEGGGCAVASNANEAMHGVGMSFGYVTELFTPATSLPDHLKDREVPEMSFSFIQTDSQRQRETE